jgi:hypothetical protein
MKIVIQCASGKRQPAPGEGFHTSDGREVRFVAHPELAPIQKKVHYARPDEVLDRHQTWRDQIRSYNNTSTGNPLRLQSAYRLYNNPAYTDLVNKFGLENIFILSAGWGLIPAGFLTPYYDITFSKAKNVKPESQRKHTDVYADFCDLPDDGDKMIFLGGKDYLPLFVRLTAKLHGQKAVVFNSDTPPSLPVGYVLKHYKTTRKTNWHYSCANDLIAGSFQL